MDSAPFPPVGTHGCHRYTCRSQWVTGRSLVALAVSKAPPVRSARSLVTIALVLVLAGHGIGAGLYFRPAADNPSSTITLGLVQGNVPTREKTDLSRY